MIVTYQRPEERFANTPSAFNYDDISLTTRHISTLSHRSEASLDVKYGPVTIHVPMIGSPMPDVTGSLMLQTLASQGALGFLHRFFPGQHSIADQVQAFLGAVEAYNLATQKKPSRSKKTGERAPMGVAVGVTGDWQKRFHALYKAGARLFCIDTANGANKQVETAVTWIKKQAPDAFLMAGNVASREGFEWLEGIGVDAIRCGVAGGSVCETKTETGIFVPTPYTVAECAHVRKKALIIADGGVRRPADFCKLLALGADLVMVGSAFAGTKESPGNVHLFRGKKYKLMRGAASFAVQQQAGKVDPTYIEGNETSVHYKGTVIDVLQRYSEGLRSSMSYMNAKTLDKYRQNVDFVFKTPEESESLDD